MVESLDVYLSDVNSGTSDRPARAAYAMTNIVLPYKAYGRQTIKYEHSTQHYEKHTVDYCTNCQKSTVLKTCRCQYGC